MQQSREMSEATTMIVIIDTLHAHNIKRTKSSREQHSQPSVYISTPPPTHAPLFWFEPDANTLDDTAYAPVGTALTGAGAGASYREGGAAAAGAATP